HHLATPEVGLETHIQDVVNVLFYEDLHEVVLVGHSYAGIVITGVADRAEDRLAHLVYFDAWIPEAGQSGRDLTSGASWAAFEETARTRGDGWLISSPNLELGLDRCGVTSPDDRQWLRERFTPQPIRTFLEPLKSAAATQRLPRTYIFCAG